MEGYLPGKDIVILGSGDIGLIMARRMTMEGAKVHAVLEIMPHSNGLTRNKVQCLEDYDIPLYLSHTITAIHGQERLTGVTCAAVDDSLTPVPGTEFTIDCDCLLLSVGLIPENELSQMVNINLDRLTGGPEVDQWRQTKMPGFFAAGNVVQVHDLVDWVSAEADIAGRAAALYAQSRLPASESITVKPGSGLRTVVPQRLAQPLTQSVQLFCRGASQARRVTLEVRGAAGESLYRKRLPIVKPSEMIVAEVPAAALADQHEINVVITQGW
jgi:NADH dehydrogenase FAD-containing subunit